MIAIACWRRSTAAHYSQLVGLARLLLDDRGQAEEVVQEAFVRTYTGWKRVRRKEDPLPYLRSTIVNLAAVACGTGGSFGNVDSTSYPTASRPRCRSNATRPIAR